MQNEEIDSVTLLFNHTVFTQTAFRACRMHEKQATSVGFLKSCILCEEVTNCSFHTIKSVKGAQQRKAEGFVLEEGKVSSAETSREVLFRGKAQFETC